MDVVRNVDYDAFFITETWLTGKDSDQKFIGDMITEGNIFHGAPRTHRKGWAVGILLGDYLKFKQHPYFQSSSCEND